MRAAECATYTCFTASPTHGSSADYVCLVEGIPTIQLTDERACARASEGVTVPPGERIEERLWEATCMRRASTDGVGLTGVAAGSGRLLMFLFHLRVRHSNCSPYLALRPRTSICYKQTSANKSANVGYAHFACQHMPIFSTKLIEHPTGTGTIPGITS